MDEYSLITGYFDNCWFAKVFSNNIDIWRTSGFHYSRRCANLSGTYCTCNYSNKILFSYIISVTFLQQWAIYNVQNYNQRYNYISIELKFNIKR